MIPIRRGFAACVSLGSCLILGVTSAARAEPVLPYNSRTHGYSGWDTSVRGDLRTVGMAGAMVGLADSRIGSVDNPAGLPMTLDSTGLQFTGNAIQDGYIQAYPSMLITHNAVATACIYPWGVGLASWEPQAEGDTYLLGTGGAATDLSVKTREYRLSGARMALGSDLSLGVSLILGETIQTLTLVGGTPLSRSAWGMGIGGGLLYQLPRRWLLGLSYTPPIHYAMGGFGEASGPIQNFFQSADSPYRLGLGTGWVPNSFFRFAAGVYLVGSSSNTALLSDDSRRVGESMTLQPRLGASYLLADFKNFQAELEAGTYLEVMRVSDEYSRMHATFAIELKPWIFNFGWGLDEARYYQNFIYSAGIDLAKVLRKLDLIPPEKHHDYAGFFPNPTHLASVVDAGLPRALRGGQDDGPGPSVIDVGLQMPDKIRTRILNAPEDAANAGLDFLDSLGKLPGEIWEQGISLWTDPVPEPPKLEFKK